MAIVQAGPQHADPHASPCALSPVAVWVEAVTVTVLDTLVIDRASSTADPDCKRRLGPFVNPGSEIIEAVRCIANTASTKSDIT